jgi:hypothetical protein
VISLCARRILRLRGQQSKDGRIGYYAVFFDNNDFKGSRMSVIMENCEKQDYRPIP